MKNYIETQKSVNAWIKTEEGAEAKLFALVDGIASGVYELDRVHKSIVGIITKGVKGEAATKARRFKTLLDLAKRARDKGVIVEPCFAKGNFSAITKELKLLMEVEVMADNLEKPKEVKATKELKAVEATESDSKELTELKELKATESEPKELEELLTTLEALKTKAPLLPLKQLKAITNTLKKYL